MSGDGVFLQSRLHRKSIVWTNGKLETAGLYLGSKLTFGVSWCWCCRYDLGSFVFVETLARKGWRFENVSAMFAI